MKNMITDIEAYPLQATDGQPYKFTLIESRISLEVSVWQIFSEAEEFSLLNVDRLSKTQYPFPNEAGSPLTYWFDLSKIVYKEGRKVTSFPSLFGDISGLKD